MNVIDMICNTLDPLGYPVAENMYEGKAEEYFVFDVLTETPHISADDEVQEETALIYIHFFTCKNPHCYKTKFKYALKDAGFSVHYSKVLTNSKDDNHIIYECEVSIDVTNERNEI